MAQRGRWDVQVQCIATGQMVRCLFFFDSFSDSWCMIMSTCLVDCTDWYENPGLLCLWTWQMNIRHTNQLRWAINFQNTGRLAYHWDAWDCKTTAAKLAEQRLFSNLIPFSNSQSRGYFLSQGTMHFQTFDNNPRIFIKMCHIHLFPQVVFCSQILHVFPQVVWQTKCWPENFWKASLYLT